VRRYNMWCGLMCAPASWWIRPVYVGAVLCGIVQTNFGEYPFHSLR
jgi:hypothetical protein